MILNYVQFPKTCLLVCVWLFPGHFAPCTLDMHLLLCLRQGWTQLTFNFPRNMNCVLELPNYESCACHSGNIYYIMLNLMLIFFTFVRKWKFLLGFFVCLFFSFFSPQTVGTSTVDRDHQLQEMTGKEGLKWTQKQEF